MKKEYQVARLLAYVTGLVNQDLLLQGRISCGENRILGTCRHDCDGQIRNGKRWPSSATGKSDGYRRTASPGRLHSFAPARADHGVIATPNSSRRTRNSADATLPLGCTLSLHV